MSSGLIPANIITSQQQWILRLANILTSQQQSQQQTHRVKAVLCNYLMLAWNMGCLASICLLSETNTIQLDYTKHDTEYCHFRTYIFYTYSILTQGTILMCNIAQDRTGIARSMPVSWACLEFRKQPPPGNHCNSSCSLILIRCTECAQSKHMSCQKCDVRLS